MTFTYGGILITAYNAATNVFTFSLTDSFVNVYSDTPADYQESSEVLAEQLDASDGLLFLTGFFDTFNLTANILTGGSLAGFVDGLISVTGATPSAISTQMAKSILTAFPSIQI